MSDLKSDCAFFTTDLAAKARTRAVLLKILKYLLLVCFLALLVGLSAPARIIASASPDGASTIFYAPFAFLRLCSGQAFAVASAATGAGEESTAVAGRRSSAAPRRFERALARVQPLLERYGYGAAVLAVMVEGMGIPTPGQTLLMAGALEAAEGRMNILLLLFLVTLAATVGNSIGYAIGRWGGRVVLEKLKVNPQRQQHLDDLFKRRGGIVILLARFLDGLRQLNGIVAGILRMPWWTFTAYNVAGAILWTCAWGLGTYYLGRDIHVIAAFFHRHARLLYVLSVIALVALVVYLLRSRVTSKQ